MWRWLGFALALALGFLVINRAAYKSFFAEDDLDNFANARDVGATAVVETLTHLKVTGGGEFRATTYGLYAILVRAFGLNYPPYVAVIQAIHLLNVLLVFFLARQVRASGVGSIAAALLYTFHAAAFDVYWKPMYAFDLLCATFALTSLILYARGRWILALLCFWLSLRAKEVTILFPLVLAAYELWLGEKRWKRLLPFFALSGVVGVLAMMENRGPETPYTFHFTWTALVSTVSYYSRQLLGIPWAGLVVLVVPFVFRDRRVWFGVAAFLLLLAPMLFLPGRLFAAYLYVPMIGLTVAMASIARGPVVAAFFLLWIPWNYVQFRPLRNAALNEAYQRRAWFTEVAPFFAAHPETDTVVWDGAPSSIPEHYISGAARLLRNRQPVRVTWIHRVSDELRQPSLVVLVWDDARGKLHVLGRQPDASYIELNETAPVWQLTSGWAGNQGHLRWMHPQATVRLRRPAGAKEFAIKVNVFGFDAAHPGRMDVMLNGAPLGSAKLDVAEPRVFRFPVGAGAEGPAEIALSVTPPLADPNGGDPLGQPILEMGFQ